MAYINLFSQLIHFLWILRGQQRLTNVLEDVLFDFGLDLRLSNGCEGRQFTSSYFFEILKNDFFSIIADHADHFLDFLLCMRLVHAFEEERELVDRDAGVFVDIDGIECLSNLIIREEFPVDIIASIKCVECIFSRYFFVIRL